MQVARAFIKLGLEPYNSVTISGFNSPEWCLSALGAILAGGFSTGLYPTNSAEMNKYIMNDSGANIFVVEDHATLKKMLPVIQGRSPSSRPLYTWLCWWSDIWVGLILILIIPLSAWVCLCS